MLETKYFPLITYIMRRGDSGREREMEGAAFTTHSF